MYDLTLAFGIMVAIHVGFILIGIYVLRLDYNAFLGMMVGAGLVGAIISKVVVGAWKDRFQVAIKQESQAGDLGKDFLGAMAILLVGSVISGTVLYRRYGIGGWLGLLGANTVVSAII